MLRQAAVDAIASRGQRKEARGALGDPYPRVRAHAATVLSGDPGSLLERATLARRDRWPMVRAAAVASLRDEADAVPVIVAAVDDPMSLVRAAAIEVLTTASHDQGWDRIHRRLRDRNEWPQVTAHAIEYVAAHCRADAVDTLLALVTRAAPANASTEDLNHAARAIEALRTLGGPDAKAALEQLRRTADVPPTLKMALEQPLTGDVRCSPAGR
jgi:HEAT repeat protein